MNQKNSVIIILLFSNILIGLLNLALLAACMRSVNINKINISSIKNTILDWELYYEEETDY